MHTGHMSPQGRRNLTKSHTSAISLILTPALLLVLCCGCTGESSSKEGKNDSVDKDSATAVVTDTPALPLPPEAQIYGAPTDEDVNAFLGYLRGHFDDIHDVIMRFHVDNPHLTGRAVVRMIWRDDRMEAGTTLSEETGDVRFGPAVLEAMRNWQIPELSGPADIAIPFATMIVGSDDPRFAESGILTGLVTDTAGKPVHGVRISLSPSGQTSGAVEPARSNREGVFIRTLIPAGEWDIVCEHDDYETVRQTAVEFAAGQHRKLDMVMKSR